MKKILPILMILVLPFFIGCLNIQNDNYYYEYDLKVSMNNVNNLTLYVPILVYYSNWNNVDILSKININGDYSYSYINTTYGQMLNCTGKGSLHIKNEDNANIPLSHLNGIYDSNNDGNLKDEGGSECKYWIFLFSNSISQINITLNTKSDHSTSSISSLLEYSGNITNNWILATGKLIWMEGD